MNTDKLRKEIEELLGMPLEQATSFQIYEAIINSGKYRYDFGDEDWGPRVGGMEE